MSTFKEHEIRDAIYALKMSPKTANRIIYYMIDVQNAAKTTNNTEMDAEILQLWKQNSRIAAIKRTREITGWGLMEAKDYVFNLEAKNGLFTASP